MKLKQHIPKIIIAVAALLCITGFITYRNSAPSSHQQMIGLLREIEQRNNNMSNPFNAKPKLHHFDSLFSRPNGQNIYTMSIGASLSLKEGQEQKAVDIYEKLMDKMNFYQVNDMLPDMGIAYMRLGERTNCMLNHNGSSCIFPIKDEGIHRIKTGSAKAIQVYETILNTNPDDLASRWLLNVAFMTLGTYPQAVPKEFLIPDLNADTGYKVKPFTDMAADLGLDVFSRAGGVIVDDFNNDGYLDIITSGWDISDPMHYFQNNKDGTFTDVTGQSGLKGITGGLNIQQVDYNNDGNLDIFVLRGAWNVQGYGNQPPSLLRNNGDGTFTDVTIPAGLLFFHPTQAATWADFNNDGYLDVFIGAENAGFHDAGGVHACMMYINNGDGTFTNVADKAHCNLTAYVKGVTSADYNHDGWPDIFVSTMDGDKYLLKNKGKQGKDIEFEDVSTQAGFYKNTEPTFTTWFFDYNNDGWPDIMVGDYNMRMNKPLGYFAAAEGLGKPVPKMGNTFLYRNNHDGTFTEVTKEVGLNNVVYSMGGNFGDLDNDGYLDMYLGTGNPDFKSLVPNRMFKNVDGKRFVDVTTSSRTGNLQKGHGVAFADLRNVGVQDIFIEMGGAYRGDSYNSSLYVNPGQSNNNWISLKLEGVKANRCAIGSHIKMSFTENGVKRSVYKDVNSGGSFGSSPLRQEIGIGQAKVIDDIEITWAGSHTVQHFKNMIPNQFLQITEGDNKAMAMHLNKLTFKHKAGIPMCMPMNANLK
ncbi:CRTAC1 family protein [Mucilaginibacter sp. BT774]|uniref:CRTAC1 family protein n=1 Tax=Mucilaginibacter sp. BT774 TaxID=3062276 RepID=UPI00267574EE|nr:CRTAC1 family protein [Mucilaginibacter sp. BT774]MDO3626694.1 CRTAC1 family protein [Mucilaginibacter sp. BT774]